MVAAQAALARGARGRCPECGKGRLFSGYLKLASACAVCGADFSHADAGDGPAVFVIFVVGALVVPAAFLLQMGLGLSVWVGIGVATVLTVLLSLLLLPPFKGVFFAAQWANKSGEGRLEG